MIAERNAEIEAPVEAVLVHLAQIVIHPARPQHRPRDAGVHRQLRRQLSDALGAREQDFVARQEILKLIEKARILVGNLLRAFDPARRQIDATTAEAHVIAHHPRARQRLEQIENLLPLAERVHQRRAQRAHVHEQETHEAGVILQARQLGGDDADILGAIRHRQPRELLDRQRVSPVVRERAEIIQPVRVRHRRQIARALGDLLVIAMQVAKDRLELHHDLAIQHHVHAEHAVRGRMMRPHRDLQQIAVHRRAVGTGLRADLKIARCHYPATRRAVLRRGICQNLATHDFTSVA